MKKKSIMPWLKEEMMEDERPPRGKTKPKGKAKTSTKKGKKPC